MFSKLSNKFIAFLVLAIFSWVILWFYAYFFVYNTWNLIIRANIDNYKLELSNSNFDKIEYVCENKECSIKNIAPLEFSVLWLSNWFNDINTSIKILKNYDNLLEISFDKKVIVKEKIEKIDINDIEIKKTSISNKKSIENFKNIRKVKKSYAYFDLWDLGYFYFIEEIDKLVLYRMYKDLDKRLFDINKVSSWELFIKKVESDNKVVFLWTNSIKYIYDLENAKYKTFNLKTKVNYIKKWLDSKRFLINTILWTFVYDSSKNTTDYFSLFKDFIYFWDDSYIWIIYKDEKQKFKNFNLDYENKNFIVYYNFISKEIKVLHKTDIDIYKITFENNLVYIYDKSWDKFEIRNIR